MTSPALSDPSCHVALLEDLTLSAWPCLKTIHHDGWVLRFAGGHTGRANSVNVLARGTLPLAGKVEFAEGCYWAQGLAPMFRLTPLSDPGLDGLLAERGYALENPSLVQMLDGVAGVGAEDGDVCITDRASPDWIDSYAAMTGLPPDRRASLAGILAAIAPTALYGAAEQDGRILSVALGVVDRGHVGIFDVATRPDSRGRGLAGRVIRTLLSRAAGLGADRAYLQVAAGNTAALPLYARMGFRTAYSYHYRRKA